MVVADLANVSSATQWQVHLNGGSIAQLSYVTSRGAEGACIVFSAAVRARALQIWVSAEFVQRCPVEHRILQDAVGSPGSKWRFFAGSPVEFLTKSFRTKSMVGLVTCAEYAGFPRDFVGVKTAKGFMAEVRTISIGASQVSGM